MCPEAAEQQAKILVVDDYQANVDIVKAFLLAEGHCVIEASDGIDALQRVESEMPDLVLLDVLMPQVDGYEVCRTIKRNPATRSIPVIMLTALQTLADKVKGLDAGADDFVNKPFEALELVARVRSHLRRKCLYDELEESLTSLQAQVDQQGKLLQLRSDLTRLLVHDMNNPLTALIGNLELALAGRSPLDERHRVSILGARMAAKRLRRMVRNLVEIDQLEGVSSDTSLTYESVDMHLLVSSVMSYMEDGLNGSGFTIDVALEPGEVPCDRELVMHVLTNLLDHALRNAAKETTIRLKGRHDGHANRYVICVTHDGPTIPCEYREAIFEKDRQVEVRAAGVSSGQGMGLPFSRLVMQAHGGDIWMESADEEVIGGRSFCISFPLSRE